MNIQYHLSPQSALSIPAQTLEIIRDLQTQIKKHQSAFLIAGFSPSLVLERSPQSELTTEKKISQFFIQHILSNTPFLSLLARASLQQKYLRNNAFNLFNHKDLLTEIYNDILELRIQEHKRLAMWLSHASYNGIKSDRHMIRIQATPDISVSQKYPSFKNPHIFENLNLLQAALAYTHKDDLPKKLIGHSISDTWSKEYDRGYAEQDQTSHKLRHRNGLASIRSHLFLCPYFSIETLRSADDCIYLTSSASNSMEKLTSAT